jgi:hypothetical protein
MTQKVYVLVMMEYNVVNVGVGCTRLMWDCTLGSLALSSAFEVNTLEKMVSSSVMLASSWEMMVNTLVKMENTAVMMGCTVANWVYTVVMPGCIWVMMVNSHLESMMVK